MNAFSSELIAAVGDAWVRVRDDGDIRSVIMTGAGDRAFSAGADLKEMASRNAADGPQRNTFWDQGEPQLYRGLELWKPIIAAVNGFALGGGCETAMSCDIRIASETASFGLPEVARGIIPGAGGTQRIPRLVPFGIALELLMTGRRIPADEAYRIGLVNHVVPPDQLMDKALEIAGEIGANAPLAVMAAKEAAYRGLNTTLQEGLRIENFESMAIRHTEDAKEGPRAFAEKREANYQGR
jgi:enoyl-CoA hydratase/carnithine racemase